VSLSAQLKASFFYLDLSYMKLPIKKTTALKRRLFIGTELETFFNEQLEIFYQENKEIIDGYLQFKEAIEELNNRVNPHYKLTILNSKTSGKILNAKLRLPFKVVMKNKKKVSYTNIHIGKLSNYPNGIKDQKAIEDGQKKVKKYLDQKFPFTFLDADNQPITIYFPEGEK
jgi:hypothetical protein